MARFSFLVLTLATFLFNSSHASKIGVPPQDRAHCKSQPQQQHAQLLSTPTTSNEISDGINATTTISSLVDQNATTTASSTSNFQDKRTSFKLDSSERLRQLRLLMHSNNYDAYLVGTNDEHGSEYVADYDRRLRFLTGFTGSGGFALITSERAALFTDGRYSIQAELELDCNWSIVISNEPILDVCKWLDFELSSRQQQQLLQQHQQQTLLENPLQFNTLKIATDARLLTLPNYDFLQAHLQNVGQASQGNSASLLLISQDLIDVVWNNEQVSSGPIAPWSVRRQPNEPIFVHPMQFTGQVSWQEKVARLVQLMAKLRARHYVISKLDNIAWLLNLRGSDIPNSPLFKSYLFLSRVPQQQQQSQTPPPSGQATTPTSKQQQQTMTSSAGGDLQSPQVLQVPALETIRIILYLDQSKVTQQVRDHLRLANESVYATHNSNATNNIRILVELRDYDSFISDLGNRLTQNVATASQSQSKPMQGRLLLDTRCNVAIHVLARAYDDRLILQQGLIDHLKAIKSDAEVEGMRQAHWRDSMAISMLLAKLDDDISERKLTEKWTEISASRYLTHLRSLLDHNHGESFETISAYGPNAAIIHYTPKEDAGKVLIGNQSTYLLDTGGQFLDGTTDITRTVHFGTPTDFQRETYTRVLMGAIDCMSLIFFQPARSPFRVSDLFIRRHLMEIGLDYAHGTGHGIGAFSLVHESPDIIEHYQEVKRTRSQSDSQQQQQANGGPANIPTIHNEPILLQPNMFTSVEPGYYKENDFGIRLENIVVTQRVSSGNSNGSSNLKANSFGRHQRAGAVRAERQLLRFEPLSLVPFEPKLIKQELLSNRQKIWLNSYNLLVRFRMTQQIKYYLAKQTYLQQQRAKSAARSSNQMAVNGQQDIASRLYLTTAPSGRTLRLQNNRGNSTTLESDEIREDLERAHRWIMQKTELISLDHPSGANKNTGPTSNKNNKRREASSRQASLLDAKRLTLAYMSSLPFNELAAREAIVALGAPDSGSRQQQTLLSARSDANQTSTSPASDPIINADTKPNCQSDPISCDLSLVTKLAAQPSLGANSADLKQVSQNQWASQLELKLNTSDTHHSVAATSDDDEDDFNPIPGINNQEKDGFLSHLFGLDSSPDQQTKFLDPNNDGPAGTHKMSGLLGSWVVVLLGSLLVLQVGLTSYAFRLHWRDRPRARGRQMGVQAGVECRPSLGTLTHPIGDHHHLGDRI